MMLGRAGDFEPGRRRRDEWIPPWSFEHWFMSVGLQSVSDDEVSEGPGGPSGMRVFLGPASGGQRRRMKRCVQAFVRVPGCVWGGLLAVGDGRSRGVRGHTFGGDGACGVSSVLPATEAGGLGGGGGLAGSGGSGR